MFLKIEGWDAVGAEIEASQRPSDKLMGGLASVMGLPAPPAPPPPGKGNPQGEDES